MSTSPNNRNCLSLHDMEKYVKGGLDAKSLRAVELHLLECELCSDAVEGYREIPFTQSDLPPVPKPVVKMPLWKTVSIAASVFICAGIAYLTWDSFNNKSRFSPDAMVAEQSVDSITLLPPPPETESVNKQLNQLLEKDKEFAALMQEPVKPGTVAMEGEDPSAWMMPQRPVEELEDIPTPQPGVKIKVTYKDTFIHELKVTDYSTYYAFKESEKEKAGSVEARFENKDADGKKDTVSDLEWVTTGAVLKKGLENFAKGNFSDAVKLFNVLVSYEPGDVNALFYGAVCYKNLSRATDAVVYLERVLQSPNISFYEEAEWELAQAYVQLKEFKKAEVLLTKIHDSKGFYSDRALDMLRRVKVKNKK